MFGIRPRVVALVATAVLLLAGCGVDARVDISVRNDGSGTVRVTLAFDAEAAQRIGGTSSVRVTDLERAGWHVDVGPHAITATHAFTGQADLATRLSELGGSGVIGNPRLSHQHSTFSTRDAASVDIDLRGLSAGVKADAALAARLRDAGIDVDALSAQLDRELRSGFQLTVALRLTDGTTRSIEVPPGARATLVATSRHADRSRELAVGIGGLLAVVALVLLGLSFLRPRRAGQA
jgi:hypothetical protein